MEKIGGFKLWGIKRRARGAFYRRNMSIVLLVTCLPTAVIAICCYFAGIKQIEKEVTQSHQAQLEQVHNKMNEQFAQLELTVNKWAINPVFGEKIRTADFDTDFNTVDDIYSTLEIIQSTNALISDVNLYLQNQHVLISNEQGVNKVDDEDQRQYYADLMSHPGTFFWTDTAEKAGDGADAIPAVLAQKVPFGNHTGTPYGALIVYLNKKQIDDLITQMNPGGTGVSFILKQDGEWVTPNWGASQNDHAMETALKTEITKRKDSVGSFIFTWNRKGYSVSYDTFLQTDWRYVIASPLVQLTAPIRLMSKLILLISLVGIVIALLLSWFASRSMYKPVKRLVRLLEDHSHAPESGSNDEFGFIEHQWTKITKERKVLQNRLELNQPHLKERFFLQLVQGYLYYLSEAELQQYMEQYGWQAEACGFTILLTRLISSPASNAAFAEGDDQLITFAAANIVEELACKLKQDTVLINFHDLSVALLVKFPADSAGTPLKNDIYHLADQMIQVLNKYLKVGVTVGVSKPVFAAADIPGAMEETRKILRFRDTGEQGQLLDVGEYINKSEYLKTLPLEIDQEIVQAIMTGNEQETLERIGKFFAYLKTNVGKELLIQQGAMQLLGSVLRIVAQMGMDPNTIYRGANLYEQLFQLREPDDMQKWFQCKLIRPYFEQRAETQGMQAKQLVQQVVETINRQYMTELSLEACADSHGVYPKRLSVLFAQVTGKNFIDYLSDVRMEKAKQLLRDTDEKINDIAVLVGYQPSYFNRTFKKRIGMTPGQYREHRQTP